MVNKQHGIGECDFKQILEFDTRQFSKLPLRETYPQQKQY